jgi:hypothetical protein
MGEFKMLAAQEVNGKPVYEKEPSVSHMVCHAARCAVLRHAMLYAMLGHARPC